MKVFQLIFLALATQGCAGEPKPGGAQDIYSNGPCDIKTAGPAEVLVGTDVLSKAAFRSSGAKRGRFSAEIGGASVEVELTTSGDLIRTYYEAGMPANAKTYSALCLDGGVIAMESGKVEFVDSGLLLWEQAVEGAMLPSDLWVYLEKE